MKKTLLVQSLALTAVLVSGAVLATPANMVIDNNTMLVTNAYVHDVASPSPLAPKTAESLPWAAVTALCHGTKVPMIKGSDSCAFDVYASYSSDPKQIHVGTVTFYVSNGEVVNVKQLALQYGLKIVSTAPGQFELDNV